MPKVPHLVQYQGSKRNLAPVIAQYFPENMNRFIEPFSGTAAMSIYTATHSLCDSFIINDINGQITNLLDACIEKPDSLADDYQEIWTGQFDEDVDTVVYYNSKREELNRIKDNPDPALTLFILARVVKGSIRYNKNGDMNQICDKRRNGTRPETIRKNAREISRLLKNHATVYNLDYKKILDMAVPGDLVYMDPPYQGVAGGLTSRYIQSLEFDHFVTSLEELNARNIDYIVSYDGQNDDGKFGKDLPEHLGLQHVLINAGRSAQGTLNGKQITTYESLYISPNLRRDMNGYKAS